MATDEAILVEDWRPHRDDTHVGTLGELFERRREGMIEIALQTDDRHTNLTGFVHGGVIMTLFDRAMGVNCRAASPDDAVATGTLTVNFLRRVRIGEFVKFRCHLKKIGRRAIFADSEAFVGDRLVATATGLFMKVRSREA